MHNKKQGMYRDVLWKCWETEKNKGPRGNRSQKDRRLKRTKKIKNKIKFKMQRNKKEGNQSWN